MRVPNIYSPIDAKVAGRSRLYAIQGIYTGCDNNGVVLIGTGDWTGKCLVENLTEKFLKFFLLTKKECQISKLCYTMCVIEIDHREQKMLYKVN